MQELNILYKDLIKLQQQQEIRKGLRQTSFWVGAFTITGGILLVSFLLV